MGVAMKQPKQRSKRELLHDILGKFGMGRITREEFESQMRRYNLTDEDIDLYCKGALE
jgi:hypothetical protein